MSSVQGVRSARVSRRRRTAALMIGGLFAGVIGLGLDASTARADSHDKKGEVEGAVANLTGSCPNITFTVLGTKVTTTEGTKFDDGKCTDVANGKRVEVKVLQAPSEGAFPATKVELKK